MKTLVLYASATGNTELIAKEIVQLLTDKGIVPDIKEFDFDEIRARDLLDYDMILFGVYTGQMEKFLLKWKTSTTTWM